MLRPPSPVEDQPSQMPHQNLRRRRLSRVCHSHGLRRQGRRSTCMLEFEGGASENVETRTLLDLPEDLLLSLAARADPAHRTLGGLSSPEGVPGEHVRPLRPGRISQKPATRVHRWPRGVKRPCGPQLLESDHRAGRLGTVDRARHGLRRVRSAAARATWRTPSTRRPSMFFSRRMSP
jgi:hypothetical protein